MIPLGSCALNILEHRAMSLFHVESNFLDGFYKLTLTFSLVWPILTGFVRTQCEPLQILPLDSAPCLVVFRLHGSHSWCSDLYCLQDRGIYQQFLLFYDRYNRLRQLF